MASIRSESVAVISSSERERSPISSRRFDRSGSEMARGARQGDVVGGGGQLTHTRAISPG